jgi:predicted amidohydrolase YtcJ
MGCAIASGWDDHLGSLTSGKYEDMVVLDQYIFSVDPADIAATQVMMTIVNGKVVYRA